MSQGRYSGGGDGGIEGEQGGGRQVDGRQVDGRQEDKTQEDRRQEDRRQEDKTQEDGQDDLASENIPILESPARMATDNEATPLPKRTLLILSCVIFSEPMCFTILFPFMYYMVRPEWHWDTRTRRTIVPLNPTDDRSRTLGLRTTINPSVRGAMAMASHSPRLHP